MDRSLDARTRRGLITVFAFVLLAASAAPTLAQVLLTDDFAYPPLSPLTGNGWAAHSSPGTNPIRVSNGGLTYPGYAGSGIGNAAGPLATSGEDDNRTFALQNTGTVYLAAMVLVNTAQSGDYFLHLGPAPVTTTFTGRLFVRNTGSGAQLGAGFTTETPVYGPTVSFGATALVVLKYQFNPGSNNDQVALFVNPPLGGLEPPPALIVSNPLAADAGNIGGVGLRQGNATLAASVLVDGIRVGRTWADVSTGATYVINASAGPGGTISPSGAVTVPTGGSQAFAIAPSGGFTIQDVIVDGLSVGPVASYTFTAVSANHTIQASFATGDGGVSGIAFEQLDLVRDERSVTNSGIGRMTFDYAPSAQPQFVNVVARQPGSGTGDWVVRNVYLPDVAVAAPIEHLAPRFPLSLVGIASGTPLSALEYDLRVTLAPITDADASGWLSGPPAWRPPVPVGHPSVRSGAWDAVPVAPIPPPGPFTFFLPFLPPINISIIEWIGCHMDNIDLDDATNPGDTNGCAPAGVANSLTWLKGEHPIDLPPNLRDTFTQLSNLMNRLAGKGASAEDMVRAKLDFIEAYDLPIRVDFQSRKIDGNVSSTSGNSSAHDHDAGDADYPTREFLESEAAHGEDIEIGGGYYGLDGDGNLVRNGGHVVVVTGVGSINGVPFITVKDDGVQEHAGGTTQTPSGIDVLPGGIMHLPGLDSDDEVFIVESVICESYDPSVTDPGGGATEAMASYCQWIKRTIRPGGKLEITYPAGTRCYNSTVWVLDRTVKPPKWRKEKVWNFNGGQTRTYVNASPYCVTIAVHNDDRTTDAGGYVPYTIGVVTSTAAGTTSPGNASVFGGFSLGGTDGSTSEFGTLAAPSVVIDPQEGLDLSTMPGRIGAGGVPMVQLTQPIASWNAYWSRLELRLEVLSVTSAGILRVTCPGSGVVADVLVDHPGLYQVPLGILPESPSFTLQLEAQPGCDFTLDALGVPSLVGAALTAPADAAPRALALRNLGANPARSTVQLRIDLPRAANVELAVYDVTGARVATLATGEFTAGSHTATWDIADARGRRVAPGLYFGRLVVDGRALTTRIAIVR